MVLKLQDFVQGLVYHMWSLGIGASGIAGLRQGLRF